MPLDSISIIINNNTIKIIHTIDISPKNVIPKWNTIHTHNILELLYKIQDLCFI